MWDRSSLWYILNMSHAERTIVVGDRGRVVLPADLRTRLGLKPGMPLLVSAEEDGSVRLRPYRSVADGNRGLLSGLAAPGTSLVDDLVAERRAEAARENQG
jgi:AbrB family looped-hinge helix DNA binding protein